MKRKRKHPKTIRVKRKDAHKGMEMPPVLVKLLEDMYNKDINETKETDT